MEKQPLVKAEYRLEYKWNCPHCTCPMSCGKLFQSGYRKCPSCGNQYQVESDYNKAVNSIISALKFYGDPRNYFNIKLTPEYPCGDFIGDRDSKNKLGNRARTALSVYHENAKI
jgi:hypothetical protein